MLDGFSEIRTVISMFHEDGNVFVTKTSHKTSLDMVRSETLIVVDDNCWLQLPSSCLFNDQFFGGCVTYGVLLALC